MKKEHPKKTSNIMKQVLDKMKVSYEEILLEQQYLPTRDRIGFTERNLTFYFCHHYLMLRQVNIKNIIVWQEMPLESGKGHDNHRQHIDSIIIDKNNRKIDIFYIEAKRIYDPSFVGALNDDYNRIKNNYQFIPGYEELTKQSTIRIHVVLLAGLEIFPKQRQSTINSKKDKLEEIFKEEWEKYQLAIDTTKGPINTLVSSYEIHAFYKEINDTTE